MAPKLGERAVSGRKVPLPTWPSPRRHWPPAYGPQASGAPSRPRPRGLCRLADGRCGRRLPIGTLPRGGPHPPLPFSVRFPPRSGQPMAPASPPWRRASLAWRRSRRAAAGAGRRPRPRSTSPCWAGRDRHPWRRLAGGLRGRKAGRDPCRSRSPGGARGRSRPRGATDARCR